MHRSIATNGFNQNQELCKGFDVTESIHPGSTDRGYPAAFYENVDYYNVFVGHYNAGDLQVRLNSCYFPCNILVRAHVLSIAPRAFKHQ